jgi:hypothetical protein
MLEFLAPIVGGALDFLGGQNTNSANRQIAAENRAFQKHMSNTAYQRANTDMRKAGLNPMLAYSKGGASSPSGSVIPMENPLKNAGNVGNQVAQNLLATKRLSAEIENLRSSTALNIEKRNTEQTQQAQSIASAGFTNAQTITETNRRDNLDAQTENLKADWSNIAFRTQINANQLSVLQAEAVLADINKQISLSSVGETIEWMKRLGLSPDKVVDAVISGFKGKIPAGLQPMINGIKNEPQTLSQRAASSGPRPRYTNQPRGSYDPITGEIFDD